MSNKQTKKANGVTFAPDAQASSEKVDKAMKAAAEKLKLQKNPNARPKPPPPDQPMIEPIWAFYSFLAVNIVAALYAPIQDCDEVFNYWEPTNYLNRRFGLQTWEYSPEFAIRSWLYIVIHAIPGKLGSLFSSKTSFEFYFIRVMLGFVCALCELRLFTTVSRILNPRIGIMFSVIMITAPGMFHASVAYLPSSFSMYMTMLGTAAFMDWRGGLKTGQGIMWFGVGAIVGWPFSAALIVPFMVEESTLAWLTKDKSDFIWRLIDGFVRCLCFLALQVAIDTFFYHKVLVVPWRIVTYNVFSGSSRGPNIFGTEPWHFYLRNLILNFHVFFLLALLAGPVIGVQFFTRGRSTTKQSPVRSMVFVAPFYLWLAIFSAQPHKEERFMYPAYPLLALNAALALHNLLAYIGSSDRKTLMGKIPAYLKLAFVVLPLLSAIVVGNLRIIGILTAYGAPLRVYEPLQRPEYANLESTVCLGKEWYRFPSSYFLPKGVRARFVKSAFDGLLPGQFNEAEIGFGFFPGTWLVPPGMNDQNIADPGKYIDISHCPFLVDSEFPGAQTSPLEPNNVADVKTWEILKCSEFLDTSQTGLIGRTIWVPDWSIIPASLRRKWGRHCLLKRRDATLSG